MFKLILFPLITVALLELVTNFVTFPPFLRSATARRLPPAGVSSSVSLGRSGLCVFRFGLVLLCNAIAVLPQSFPVNQVLHGLMEEVVRPGYLFGTAAP